MTSAIPCVCGHAQLLHSAGGCLKAFLGCNCVEYFADDGNEGGPVSACYMSYTGIYKKHYTLDETA